MAQKCKNCAWFCHTDGRCYATAARLSGLVPASYPAVFGELACRDWTFDGLEDWEREPEEALMTMEAETMI